ncbi:DEKNAAC104536 [Brettanomyces naardenensis]|uniref:DEKNAAC104536 n=1 Tax=Brettanomyces naardenensis TaxID=13370 RepID=A0A448YRH4_BRENA|nr:DEKNAAC104536 [Brettanomyces naardenensis]
MSVAAESKHSGEEGLGKDAANGISITNGSNGSLKRVKRVDIDDLVAVFQKRMGKNWDEYQIAVSLFLVGKLSRSELLEKLDTVLDNTTVRFHNQLLLANLANCVRAEPSDGMSTSGFGNQSQLNRKRKAGRSSQYDILKKDILSLPIRERKRLKNITRESGKKGMTNSTMVLTRQAILPKVPIQTPKVDTPQTKESVNATVAQASKWAQDVSNGFKAPLCSESYELPEKEALMTRMLGIAREHGLSGSVNPQAAQLLTVGLEYHLKALVEMALARVRERQQAQADFENPTKLTRKNKRITLTIEDMHDTLTLVPHLVDDCGSLYYMSDVLLKNDDDESLVQLQRQPREQLITNASEVNDGEVTKSTEIVTGDDDNSEVKENGNKEELLDGDTVEKPTGKRPLVHPKKYSPITYLLEPKTSVSTDGSQVAQEESTSKPNLALNDPSIGTPNDLNWLLNDLLAE